MHWSALMNFEIEPDVNKWGGAIFVGCRAVAAMTNHIVAKHAAYPGALWLHTYF